MPTLDQDRLEVIAQQPKAASNDAGSASAHDLGDVIDVLDRKASEEAVTSTNANGGPKSPWHCTRPARAFFPGAHR